MRISELVAESGVSTATVKYYLREGLLRPGRSTGARSAEYDEEHLQRLRAIAALTDVAGLPLSRVKRILQLIDEPDDDLFGTLGAAVGALPPDVDDAPADMHDYPRARAVLERLGQIYRPEYSAVPQLERALQAAESVGLGISDERIDVYGAAVRAMAEFDVEHMPRGEGPSASVEYAVLGTALYEPVLLALRRLAHQQVAAERIGER